MKEIKKDREEGRNEGSETEGRGLEKWMEGRKEMKGKEGRMKKRKERKGKKEGGKKGKKKKI